VTIPGGRTGPGHGVNARFTAASVTKGKATDNIDLSGEASGVAEAISQAKRGLQLIIANLDSAVPQLVLANDTLGTLS
jgi:hypothetical protein